MVTADGRQRLDRATFTDLGPLDEVTDLPVAGLGPSVFLRFTPPVRDVL